MIVDYFWMGEFGEIWGVKVFINLEYIKELR